MKNCPFTALGNGMAENEAIELAELKKFREIFVWTNLDLSFRRCPSKYGNIMFPFQLRQFWQDLRTFNVF